MISGSHRDLWPCQSDIVGNVRLATTWWIYIGNEG